jgi:hypothetical protein
LEERLDCGPSSPIPLDYLFRSRHESSPKGSLLSHSSPVLCPFPSDPLDHTPSLVQQLAQADAPAWAEAEDEVEVLVLALDRLDL